MKTRAELSSCQSYRYALWREWSEKPLVLFVMLNPSTADDMQDDPTIRRCIAFAKQWGHGGLIVANLFAWRSPYPAHLRNAGDPIGPDNDAWLEKLANQSSSVIGAWGNHGSYMQRGQKVAALFPHMQCLGITKQGQPRHPLYVPSATMPVPMQSGHV